MHSLIPAVALTLSLGVNTHISQQAPGYLDGTRILRALDYLGTKDIRDGIGGSVSLYKQLAAAGVHLDADWDYQSLRGMIASARALDLLGPNALRFIEGPNEISRQPIAYKGQDTRAGRSFLPAAQLMADIYRAVKSEPALSKIPVIALTDGGAQPDNVGLQFLVIPPGTGAKMPDGTRYADYANIHAYPDLGHQPMFSPEGDVMHHEYVANFGHTWGPASYAGYSDDKLKTLPRVMTEFGYPTIGRGTDARAVDEPTQARNTLNMVFDGIRHGYAMMYLYELVDEPSLEGDEAHYGLFHADYTPKQVAVAIHDLNRILRDDGADALGAAGSLPYAISGLPATGDSMLIAKSDGTLDLAVWNEPANWDAAMHRSVPAPKAPIEVNLGGCALTVRVFDPLLGASPIQTLTGVSRVPLTLTDHPLILEVEVQKAGLTVRAPMLTRAKPVCAAAAS